MALLLAGALFVWIRGASRDEELNEDALDADALAIEDDEPAVVTAG